MNNLSDSDIEKLKSIQDEIEDFLFSPNRKLPEGKTFVVFGNLVDNTYSIKIKQTNQTS